MTMKENWLRRVLVGSATVVLLLTLPSQAQDDWPERCAFPDLEAATVAANSAQAEGDMVAFLNALSHVRAVNSAALRTCLEPAVAEGVDLSGVDLGYANLLGAILSGARLEGAFMRGAHLEEADLWNANLQEAYLGMANLEAVSLVEANLQGANLHWANLRGADLSRANLVDAHLTAVMFSDYTLFPDGSAWTPGTDTDRFTDPEHPDFWDPCVALEEAPWYCD
jgi:uncharacterized protein YjbI with pentapeptide repeats